MSISRAIQNFPNVSVSFCLILIDKSHKFYNRESQFYAEIKYHKDNIKQSNNK